MLTSWLWIHSPDRHRGVDVVCSNRSLGLESTSSVVNDRRTAHSPGPPAQKRKNHTDDHREQLRRGSEDRPCTHSPARRSIDVVDVSSWSIPRFQVSFSRQLNSSEIYVFCSFEWSPCIVPGNRKKFHWGEEAWSLKRPRISALASSGEENRPSIEMTVYDAYASWRDVRLRRVTKTKWRNCREPP